MSSPTIAGAKISALAHPILALEDQPALSADDLKAYFDANPQQLCDAHNTLVSALKQTSAASEIGFSPSAGVPSSTVQQAVESVQQQLQTATLGDIPNGSITAAKLDSSIQQKLNQLASITQSITALQGQTALIYPFCAQFPLMVLALADGCPTDLTDELSTAALGYRLDSEVHQLGRQLAWLCTWKQCAVQPSAAFRAKQTFGAIINDASTLQEIASLTPVRSLILKSSILSRQYYMALEEAENP